MRSRLTLTAALGAALAVTMSSADAELITFDFASGNSNNNSQNGGAGNWNPVPVTSVDPASNSHSTTIGGVGMTITGIAVDTNGLPDEFWGTTSPGIGIQTDFTTAGLGNSGATRINSEIGEAIQFSFDADVFLVSFRANSLNEGDPDNPDTPIPHEEVHITPNGGPAIITLGDPNTNAQTDHPLGDVFVSAGTPILFQVFKPIIDGAIFSEITVRTVPEPSALMLALGAATLCVAAGRRRG